jgi:hypothetical protein
VADQLSQTNVIRDFWRRRTDQITRQECYHQAG